MDPKIETNIKKEQLPDGQFMLTIENTDSVDITKKTYVYIRDLNGTDTFSNVASVFDINTFSEDVPASGQIKFRVEKCELEFDSIETMNRVANSIIDDLRLLVNDWKALEGNISVTYDVEIEAD